MDSPIYQHDCKRCTYLGSCEYEGRSYDLYSCDQWGLEETVVARFGDDGPDYMSGMAIAEQCPPDHPLAVALARRTR